MRHRKYNVEYTLQGYDNLSARGKVIGQIKTTLALASDLTVLRADKLFLKKRIFQMEKQTDPVCGMQIEKADAAGQSDYNGRTFYFCSSACKEQFDANPARFITNESENQ